MKRMIHLVLMLLCFAVASAQVHKKGMTMKLTIDGQVFHVNTNDDPLVKQIAVMCPLSLEFSRSGNHEYYSRLPRKVDESNSTKTTKAHAGELMYFGGWNCLSLLFADADVAPYQLVKIGEFDREIVSLLKKSGNSVKVEIGIE